ncbi:hypothetical protein L1887_08342 [Cichorium endivia]|nr:hypothetical protein L1887_08342 [Cichorium endivia]
MGKKRVSYDCNDLDKPPMHVITDHHNDHRHHNQPKAKKIKPDAKLLHTLSSHFKKLGKSRSRNTPSISTPPPPPPATTISHESNIHRHGHQCHREQHLHDWCKGFDSDHDQNACHDDHGDNNGVFKFGQELCWKTLLSEINEDLFGGDCVFAPDLNASRKMVVVFEDGFGCGSYIPDPVVNWDNGDGGNCLYDILKLSSQEDMLNEFLKVNLFVS